MDKFKNVKKCHGFAWVLMRLNVHDRNQVKKLSVSVPALALPISALLILSIPLLAADCGIKISHTLCQAIDQADGMTKLKILVALDNVVSTRKDTIRPQNCDPNSLGKPCEYVVEVPATYDTSKTHALFSSFDLFLPASGTRLLVPMDTNGIYVISNRYIVNANANKIVQIANSEIVQVVDLLGSPSTFVVHKNTNRPRLHRYVFDIDTYVDYRGYNALGRLPSIR